MLSINSLRHVGAEVFKGVSVRCLSAAALPQPITQPDVKVRLVEYRPLSSLVPLLLAWSQLVPTCLDLLSLIEVKKVLVTMSCQWRDRRQDRSC